MKIHLQLTSADRSFIPSLKPLLQGHNVGLNDAPIGTITEVEMRATARGAKHIATTNPTLLYKLLRAEYARKKPSLDDYAGSIIERNGYEYLILNPLDHLVTTPTGNFLYKRYFSKFTDQQKWFPVPNFTWEIATPASLGSLYTKFSSASFIAVDIETIKEQLAITCSGYCGVWFDSSNNTIKFHAIVIPCTDEFMLAWIGKFNQLPAPKIMQNGKYDNAYFLRWGIPPVNWTWDTLNLFHCWYSELPKRLDFIASFILRKWEFWKDEADVPIHSEQYYRYNAKDAFTTAIAFLGLMQEMPSWARQNYQQEFPLVFPCLQAELTGLKRNESNFQKLKDQIEEAIASELQLLRSSLGEPNFNPNSPKQVVQLWKVLGSSDISSSDTPARDIVKNRHPINRFVVDRIENIRKNRKLLSSYLKDGLTLHGRILYQLNPSGTDTGRLASAESHYWCGLQIQNIPRDRTDIVYKGIFAADKEFYIGEGDYDQAESRGTAYLSGDTSLIETVNSDKDFHALNASSFFGIPYEKIVDALGDVLDKTLRDLSKRVNHGANYNMAEQVLLNTMGIENVLRARSMLRLPKNWTLLEVCRYLLAVFDKTYPIVRGPWYDKIKVDVITTHMLVGPTGWTRYCFGNPVRNKRDMNRYAAHPPQSLNAMTLNQAWLKVFYEVALPNPKDFKLCAQIHDSILFQYRVGRDDLIRSVHQCMLFDTAVVDTFGTSRILRVPVSMKAEGKTWADVKKVDWLKIAA